MPDAKPVKLQRPAVTEVWDLRVAIDAMVGPKAIYPNTPVENGKDGFTVFVDESGHSRGVWIVWDRAEQECIHTTLLPWENIRYIRWRPMKREREAT